MSCGHTATNDRSIHVKCSLKRHQAGPTAAAPSCRHLVPRVPYRGRPGATLGTSSTNSFGTLRGVAGWRVFDHRAPGQTARSLIQVTCRVVTHGAGEGIRTPDPLITNQLLYRTELRQPDKRKF